MTNTNTIVLLDADSILFASCLKKKEDTEDGKGFIYDTYEAVDKFNNTMVSMLATIEQECKLNILHTVIFLEGEGNFRYSLNKSYKSNRKAEDRPPLLPYLKRWVADNYNEGEFSTFISTNVETDDSIAATFSRFKDEIPMIIVSKDKDTLTLPANILRWTFKKNVDSEYEFQYKIHVQSPFEAEKFLFKQMLMGDAADGVKGIPRVGEKTAEKLLKGCDSRFSLIRATYTKYKQKYRQKAPIEFRKAYSSLKLIDKGIKTPDLDFLIF